MTTTGLSRQRPRNAITMQLRLGKRYQRAVQILRLADFFLSQAMRRSSARGAGRR